MKSPPLSGVPLRCRPPLSGMSARRALSCPEHAEHRQHGIPAGKVSQVSHNVSHPENSNNNTN